MFKWLCLIVGYLIIISSLIGFFVYESENERISTLNSITYSTDAIDFSGVTSFDKLLDTSWNGASYCEIVNDTLVISPAAVGDVAVYFKGIQPNTNGIYDVTYGINNYNSADFSIIITSDTESLTPTHLTLSYSADNEQIKILYASSSVIGQYFADSYFTKTINLNGVHDIQTEFNPATNDLIITIDDIKICNVNIYDYENENIIHYGGGIITDDFIINYVKTSLTYSETDENDLNFLSLIGTILAWNVSEEYLPVLLNIIFIKIPMLFLAIATALYIRGVA